MRNITIFIFCLIKSIFFALNIFSSFLAEAHNLYKYMRVQRQKKDDFSTTYWYFYFILLKSLGNGSLAHLEERFHGMEEVAGSIPVRSTRMITMLIFIYQLFYFLINISSGFDKTTLWFASTDWVKNTFEPITTLSPIWMSPKIEAPE